MDRIRAGAWLLAVAILGLSVYATHAQDNPKKTDPAVKGKKEEPKAEEKKEPKVEIDPALKKQALALNDITGSDALDEQLRKFIKDREAAKKLLAVAGEMAKDKDQPFGYNAALLLGKTAAIIKDPKASEMFYRLAGEKAAAIKSSSKLLAVYDGLISMHLDNNDYEKAAAACKEFIKLPGDEQFERTKPFVQEKLIQSIAKQGKIEEALKLTQELLDDTNDSWYFMRLKAIVQREGELYQDSADTYLEVLKKLRRSDLEDEVRERFSEQIRYSLSSVYIDLKEIDKAAEQLEMLLKKKPDNATFNNDLGYIWADHDMKLDEAEKLIRKALDEDKKMRDAIKDLPEELNKENSSFLDSLGWVLFKKKNYAEAKKYLLKATEDEVGQHIEVLDHLADVHIQLGEIKEAVAVWEKALKVTKPTSKRERAKKAQVEEKLKKYKPMVK